MITHIAHFSVQSSGAQRERLHMNEKAAIVWRPKTKNQGKKCYCGFVLGAAGLAAAGVAVPAGLLAPVPGLAGGGATPD